MGAGIVCDISGDCNCFLEKRRIQKNYWITLGLFTVCLIMTKSGAGIAMMPLILIIKLTDRKDEELSLRRNVLLCGVLILIFLLLDR